MFFGKSDKPTAETLKISLGKTFPFFEELLKITANFSKEWNYSKTSGWIEKIYDRQKALFYLIPLEGSFKIGLTIRENEKDVLLTDKKMWEEHDRLNSAKKYSEGYAIQFQITDRKSFRRFVKFINKIMGLRKK